MKCTFTQPDVVVDLVANPKRQRFTLYDGNDVKLGIGGMEDGPVMNFSNCHAGRPVKVVEQKHGVIMELEDVEVRDGDVLNIDIELKWSAD